MIYENGAVLFPGTSDQPSILRLTAKASKTSTNCARSCKWRYIRPTNKRVQCSRIMRHDLSSDQRLFHGSEPNGPHNIQNTVRYFGVKVGDAISLSQRTEIRAKALPACK